MRYHSRALLLLLGALLLATAHPVRADVITNGSFETPIVTSPSGFLDISPGSEPPGFGWRVTSGNVDVVVAPSEWASVAFDGSQFLDLDGYVAGAIVESFATTPGDAYVLSFAYANNLGGTIPARATVRVFDGTNGSDLIAPFFLTHGDSTVADLDWKLSGAIPFVAQGTTSTLSFMSNDPSGSDGGIFLDAVSVKGAAAIPEPGSFAMVLICLGLVSAVRARHR